jgi:hypothetical protein
MAKKVRLCRAVESNVGERRAYKKQLLKIQDDFSKFVLNEIFVELQQQNILAMDSVFTPVESTKQLLQKLKKAKINLQPNADIGAIISDIVSSNINSWLRLLRVASTSFATKFVKKAIASTARAQKQALKSAGVNAGAIEKAFTVPVVSKQFVSPAAAQMIPDYVEQNVRLITHIGEKDITRISEVISKGVESGLDYSKIVDELKATDGFNSARAERVALDQINKINQQVQLLNAEALGCTKARWKHVAGQFTSRPTHVAMDGKEFDIKVGMFDPAVNKYIKTGELPFCRCVARIIAPKEILNDE